VSTGATAASRAGVGQLFSFCGKPLRYTPIYEKNPANNTASVNAGDYNLYVGGGAINRAFANALGLEARNGYRQLHSLLLRQAEETPGQLVQFAPSPEHPTADGLLSELRLSGSFARLPGGLVARARGPVGSAFVDVFEPARRPRSAQNVAMLYVVGPKGQGARGGHGPTVGGREAFLEAVTEMAANALCAVKEYNLLQANVSNISAAVLPRIDTLQWCLVSGGVYRHPDTSKLDVALATVEGLLAGASGPAEGDPADGDPDGALPRVRFAYDDGVFEEAMRRAVGV